MIIKSPFFIGARLAPALKIGDSTLSLIGTKIDGERDRATFALDTPTFEHIDNELRSGCGGFRGMVEIFKSFLSFLLASTERDLHDGLFPPHVVEWAADNVSEIQCALSDIEDENGRARDDLITDN